jgi:hypothetical protein
MKIRPVPVEQTRWLRQQILRPHIGPHLVMRRPLS